MGNRQRPFLESIIMTKVDKVITKLYKKERQKIGYYIGIPSKMYEHNNFKTLSPTAKVILLELTHRWSITNNGQIVAGIKSLAKSCDMCVKATHKALKILESRGFIIKTKAGLYTTKEASEYLLTYRGKVKFGDNVEVLDLWKYWREGNDFADEDQRDEVLLRIRKGEIR